MSESESLTLQPSEAESPPVAAVAFEAVRPPVGRAIAAAAPAAALGAAAWAVMVIVTDHSFGLAAAGLGILSGKLVHRFTGGKRGVMPAAVAAVATVVALVVGKSPRSPNAFHANLGTEFSAFYLLWVGFGVLAAWRIVGPARRAWRR